MPENITEAQKIFEKQKEQIKAISDTTGYKEIKKYFEREREDAQNKLLVLKNMDELVEVQTIYKHCNWFIEFLNTREEK